MKVFGFTLAALCLLAAPTLAAEYQGKTIDGKRFNAQVYSYQTGGVFDAQVEFQRDLAIVYFVSGSQLTIRLNQPSIQDPTAILGYGRLGSLPLTRWLSLGLATDNGITGGVTLGGGRFEDLWQIKLTESLETAQPQ